MVLDFVKLICALAIGVYAVGMLMVLISKGRRERLGDDGRPDFALTIGRSQRA